MTDTPTSDNHNYLSKQKIKLMQPTDAAKFKQLLLQAMQQCNIREVMAIFDYIDDTAPLGGTGLIHTAVDKPTPAYLHMAMQANAQLQQFDRNEKQRKHNAKAQKN